VAAIFAGWLALSNPKLACRWIATLGAGMAVVGATKILYAGWGMSLAPLEFRVISGHTMLSTSVWMAVLALHLKWWRLPPLYGAMAGLVIGSMTGISRVLNLSHSWSEVVVGWVIGVAVAVSFLRAALGAKFERPRPMWSAASLLVVSALAYGHTAPIQDLIDAHSPAIHRHAPSVSALLGRIGFRAHAQDAVAAK
jgi:membrane-associated phospholipid phosphatase